MATMEHEYENGRYDGRFIKSTDMSCRCIQSNIAARNERSLILNGAQKNNATIAMVVVPLLVPRNVMMITRQSAMIAIAEDEIEAPHQTAAWTLGIVTSA